MSILAAAHFEPALSAPGLGYKQSLLNGDAGTQQTIEVMRRLIDEALDDPNFIRQVIEIIRPVASFDEAGEVEAIYNWFRRNIRYTKDPVTKEKLYPPGELLKVRAGDCDDISMAISASLLAIGTPARLITLATNPDNPSEWTHIYPEAEIPANSGNWVALDAARVDSAFGSEPPDYFRKRAWDVASNNYEDLAGTVRPRPRLLGGYTGIGQGDGVNWTPIVSQSLSEIPTIIAATSGAGSATSPYGTYTAPYSSYQTPYSPGYGLPQAGYNPAGGAYTGGISFGSTSVMPLLLLGGLFLLMMSKR